MGGVFETRRLVEARGHPRGRPAVKSRELSSDAGVSVVQTAEHRRGEYPGGPSGWLRDRMGEKRPEERCHVSKELPDELKDVPKLVE